MVLSLSRRYTRFACMAPGDFHHWSVDRLLGGADEYATYPAQCAPSLAKGAPPAAPLANRKERRARRQRPPPVSEASRAWARICVEVGMADTIVALVGRERVFHAFHVWRLRARLRAILRNYYGQPFVALLERVRRRRARIAAVLQDMLARARRRLLLARASALLAGLERVRARRQRTRELFRAALAAHARLLKRALSAVRAPLIALFTRVRARHMALRDVMQPALAAARERAYDRREMPHIGHFIVAGARMHTFASHWLQVYSCGLVKYLSRDRLALSGVRGTALDALYDEVHMSISAVIHQHARCIDAANASRIPGRSDVGAHSVFDLIPGALLGFHGHLSSTYLRFKPRLKKAFDADALSVLRRIEDVMFMSAVGAIMVLWAIKSLEQTSPPHFWRLAHAISCRAMDPSFRREVSELLPRVMDNLESAGQLAYRHRYNALNPIMMVHALCEVPRSTAEMINLNDLQCLDNSVTNVLQGLVANSSLRERTSVCARCRAEHVITAFAHPSHEYTVHLPGPGEATGEETVYWRKEDGTVFMRKGTGEAPVARTVRLANFTSFCRGCLGDDTPKPYATAFFAQVGQMWTLETLYRISELSDTCKTITETTEIFSKVTDTMLMRNHKSRRHAAAGNDAQDSGDEGARRRKHGSKKRGRKGR